MRVLVALIQAALSAAEPLPPVPGTLTRAPEVVEFVAAEYPPEAEAAGVQGDVLLSIVVDEQGSVRQAVVLDPGPHPGFAAAALHAIQRFRFRPAEIDGAPAAVEIEYRYAFVLRPPEPPAAAPAEAAISLEGRVLERGTRSPVAGATVESQGVSVETDAAGCFSLRGITPGDVIVRVASPEHEPFSATEKIEEGKVREIEYRITRRHYDPYEAVVRGERERKEIAVRTVEAEEVRTVAGTQGDTLKVLQDLPGVARAPFGMGLLVVRGSEPSDTIVYLDGVPVPLLFHFGGITSVVNSDVLDALDFQPGNFGVAHGRALGGMVDVRTRDAKREWHGAAQVDVFDGRAEVEGPVGKGSAFASIRRSWIDAVLAATLPQVAPDAANDLRVAPRYYDYQTKLSMPLLGGEASFFAFGSDDKTEFIRAEDAPGRPSLYFSTIFHRAGASLRRPFGAATNELVLAVGRDSLDVLSGGSFGLLTEIQSVTLRDALSWKQSDRFRLDLGLDAIVQRFEYSIYAPSGDPGGGYGGETVGERASGTWFTPAGWIEGDFRVLLRLRVVGGVRLDADSRLTHAKAWVDPRVAAILDVDRATKLTAAAGIYGSAPAPEETTRIFGNPELVPSRALHLSLGVRRELPWAARAELTGFYKNIWSLVVPTTAVDGQNAPLRLSNEGLGEVVGLELLVRRELSRGLFGWIAWTWSRSIRRDDHTDDTYPGWHLFGLDQTHVLALILSYRLADGWILGSRVRAVTGNPYTPWEGHYLDADTGRYRCLPSSHVLSARLPAFFQADARLDKRWVFASWMLSLYVDVQNVSNRENAEFRFTSYDCTEDVPVPSIPFLPALGLRAEW